MGMDVSGRNPSSEEGEYFRANIWSWSPILHLIRIANKLRGGRLVGQSTLEKMSFNDGAGLTSQSKCDALADVLEVLVQDDVKLKQLGFVLWSEEDDDVAIGYPVGEEGTAVDKKGHFVDVKKVREGKVPGVTVADLRSDSSTSRKHMLRFCKFLRACGGFQVY